MSEALYGGGSSRGRCEPPTWALLTDGFERRLLAVLLGKARSVLDSVTSFCDSWCIVFELDIVAGVVFSVITSSLTIEEYLGRVGVL